MAMAMAQPCCASSFCGHNPGGGAHLASSRASPFVGGSLAFKSHNNSSSLSERGEEERRRRTVGPLSVQAKGRRSPIPGRKPQPMPSLPKVDDDGNPKFVLFIRTKNVPRWYPLSIVTGGTTAKVMVAAMSNEWGKKFYQGTLTRNIAGVIYKDERAVKQAALKQYPVLKAATGFEYGYKIMDTKNPKAALFGSDVIQVPPQEELKSVVDKVKDFLETQWKE